MNQEPTETGRGEQSARWQRAIARAAEHWAVLSGLVLLAMTAVTVVNVGGFALDMVTQHFGSRFPGLPGYEEMVRLWVGPAAFMMLPYCQLKFGHVAVDFLISNASPAVRRSIDILSLVLAFALAIFLIYWNYYGMLDAESDGVISHLLGWHEWVYYIPGLISFVLWALVIVSLLADMLVGDPARREERDV